MLVPMPDWSTCEEAVAQTKNEFNPAKVSCSMVRNKTTRRSVEPLMPGSVRAGEPFAAMLVVWGGRSKGWCRCGPWPSVSVPFPFFPF